MAAGAGEERIRDVVKQWYDDLEQDVREFDRAAEIASRWDEIVSNAQQEVQQLTGRLEAMKLAETRLRAEILAKQTETTSMVRDLTALKAKVQAYREVDGGGRAHARGAAAAASSERTEALEQARSIALELSEIEDHVRDIVEVAKRAQGTDKEVQLQSLHDILADQLATIERIEKSATDAVVRADALRGNVAHRRP